MGNSSLYQKNSKGKQFSQTYINNISLIINDQSLNFIDKEKNTFSDLNSQVLLIQSAYRRMEARKKFRSMIGEKIKAKRELLISVVPFKNSWELYFKKRNEYAFSLLGLNKLEKDIKEFYDNFFDINVITHSSSKITLSQIQAFQRDSLLDGETRKCLMISMKREFYLGSLIEFQICNNHIFFEEFEIEGENSNVNGLSNLDDMENIPWKSPLKTKDFIEMNDLQGPLYKKLQNWTNFNYPNKKTKRSSITANIVQSRNSSVRDPKVHLTVKLNINKNDFQKILSKRRALQNNNKHKVEDTIIEAARDNSKIIFYSEEDISSFDDTSSRDPFNEKVLLFAKNDQAKEENSNEIYFIKLLREIKEIQKKDCNYKSFQDPQTQVIYSGSFNPQQNTKEGLGFEYYIETKDPDELQYKYCGYFKRNKFHGIGMLAKSNSEGYFGEFRDGKKNGFGYLFSDEYYYKGFFKDDKFEGYGEMNVDGKFCYSGLWKKGYKSVFGFYEMNNGGYYCGEFANNFFTGTGFFRWPEGQTYLGSWNENMMDGLGEYYYKNGDKFIGFYQKDLKHGKGIYTFVNGNSLKGRWIKGKKEGIFFYIDAKSKDNTILKYENDFQIRIY